MLAKRYAIGVLSSVFDYATFAVLLWWRKAELMDFRTGWFFESVVSAAVIVLVHEAVVLSGLRQAVVYCHIFGGVFRATVTRLRIARATRRDPSVVQDPLTCPTGYPQFVPGGTSTPRL